MEENPTVSIVLDERAIRALSSAVNFTLDKWAGQGFMDQEELFCLKPFLYGAILEFDLMRSLD
jgi:hypothetical protein|tara:strand:- start:1838 stop:2026 length:189 start_codon:yes stop_codon:yes gene_type:complete